jgi:hypothetical protein
MAALERPSFKKCVGVHDELHILRVVAHCTREVPLVRSCELVAHNFDILLRHRLRSSSPRPARPSKVGFPCDRRARRISRGASPRAAPYLNRGLRFKSWRRVVAGRCGCDRSADARPYLGARPWGRRRDGRWVDPRGATPAARSLVDRRPWAGVAAVAGAGRKTGCHLGVVGVAERSAGQVTGSRASGPSSRSVWKQRRASLRAIVSDALVCESPRALSAR